MTEIPKEDTIDVSQKLLPHGVDVFKEDLDGEYWWLKDNDYLFRGYRTKLSFAETFKSLFRSHNETMNIWTHLIGVVIFFFLIYLTYAIPVGNIFTLRQDVIHENAVAQCTMKDYADIINDEVHVNASCVDAASRDESVANQFSALFYYLSAQKNESSIENVTSKTRSYFSWYGSENKESLSSEYMSSIVSSLKSLCRSLTSFLQTKDDSKDKKYVAKYAAMAEVLTDDLEEMNHKVVGHVPRWPIIIYLACAIWCVGGSAMYHHYYCLSFVMSNVLQTLDYCGICILISGSYVPVIYYSLYCYPKYMKIHLAIVVTLNVINVCIMATPKFRQPEYRSVRAYSFTLVACYAVVAMIHCYILEGFNNSIFSVMFWYVIGMGATYILGAFFYGSRIPEKYWPGHFDYILSSHQIFHVCIVIAALFHYVGSYQVFVDRFNSPCVMH